MARVWEVWIALLATAAALHAPLTLVLEGADVLRPLPDLLFAAFFAVDAVWRRRRAPVAGPPTPEGAAPRSGALGSACDLISVVPFQTLLGPTPLQLLRLLKLQRVAQLLHRWRYHAVEHAGLLRLVFFLYWLSLLTHGIACGWIALRGALAGASGWSSYVWGFYWTVTTLSTVGYGDITPATDAQRIYAMFVMMTGVGVYGFIIGTVASILASIDPARVSHLQRMEELSAFMAYRNLPPLLRQRIGAYYRYLWQKRLDHDETEILDRLPPSLRTEVSLYLKRDLLQAVPLFRGAQESFLRDIALQMKPAVFLPGDEILRAGEQGREMYFISRGSVEVVARDGSAVLARLHAGDFFGEVALVYDEPRNATVRASEYCDLYRLERDLFRQVLARYPEIAAEIETRARERRDGGR